MSSGIILENILTGYFSLFYEMVIEAKIKVSMNKEIAAETRFSPAQIKPIFYLIRWID